MWHLNFPLRDPASVSCIGRWILHHWTTREVSSGLLLVLGFLRNLLGLCSNSFPWTGRPKSFWYFSYYYSFCASPERRGCFLMRMGCFLMRMGCFLMSVEDAPEPGPVLCVCSELPLWWRQWWCPGIWACPCPAVISRASSPGSVVLTMLVSVPRLPRYRGLCAVLQALQVGHICLSKVVSLQLPQ